MSTAGTVPFVSPAGQRFLASVPASPADLPTSQKVLALGIMCIGFFIAYLDIQIVAASIKEIGGGLSASQDEVRPCRPAACSSRARWSRRLVRVARPAVESSAPGVSSAPGRRMRGSLDGASVVSC